MSDRLVAVALPLPLQNEFTYRLPPAGAVPERGARVLVPFGSRRVIGVVTGSGQAVEKGDLKDVLEVLDESPLVAPPLLDLAAWVADHYLAPPGEAYRLALPPAGVRASRSVARLAPGARAEGDPVIELLRDGPLPLSTLGRRLGRDPSSRLLALRRAGQVSIEQSLDTPSFAQLRVACLTGKDESPKGRTQRQLLERLREAGGRAPVPELVGGRSSLRASLARLIEGGWVRVEEERRTREPARLSGGSSRPLVLSTRQAPIVATLCAALDGGFQPFLLHGVTGSGKTEIYFRTVERALETGKGALILVPEIALTPLLVRGAANRFGPTVSVLHSELSDGERHDQWWRIREGDARVVVGARSAVFAPIEDLGVVVVDEEQEAAYKQEESPRYHARDVAVMRAKLEGAVVVLGSATPSLESYANAQKGKYTLLSLPERIAERRLPGVCIVDRREVLRAGGDPILTPVLVEALAARVQAREQALVLLNRRGYATSLLCRECGAQAECPNCSVSLTVHQAGRSMECHYCGHTARMPPGCPACRGEYLRLAGHGTEKVVEAVRAAVPEARVARMDRDLARRRGAVARVLAAFEAGEIDVLVGTQMIAKGHDFPKVTLVGVVDADVGLGLPDFRSAERTFQLLTQVAGRAGRGELRGEVILQSMRPDHYALRLACDQDYPAFFERELEFRRTMAYPPSSALLNVVVRARELGEAMRTARALAERLRQHAGRRYRVLGPALAPLARLRNEHRCQVLLKGSRAAMRESVRAALQAQFGGKSWRGVAVDVDPVSIM
jgi:primosomal protein N' (replication factor Y)